MLSLFFNARNSLVRTAESRRKLSSLPPLHRWVTKVAGPKPRNSKLSAQPAPPPTFLCCFMWLPSPARGRGCPDEREGAVHGSDSGMHRPRPEMLIEGDDRVKFTPMLPQRAPSRAKAGFGIALASPLARLVARVPHSVPTTVPELPVQCHCM